MTTENINSGIRQILQQYWGYPAFRPLQEEIIRSVLQGKDTLALLPTGGGKSVCFQVPALYSEGICLVITPLIALMKDQVEQLRNKGILAHAVHSGISRREIDIILDRCTSPGIKFLYLSPERLKTELLKERVKNMQVNLLAIDEAHCISQWGYDFRPSYLDIAEFRELIPQVPMIALTATATPEVRKDIMEKLRFKSQNVFTKSFARANLSYSCFKEEDKEKKILKILQNVPGSSVIYVRSRKKTKEIADFLVKKKIPASFYHAGLDYAERTRKQENWISGQVRVMAATNAFGMGIDKPNVRTVIHYDLPDSLEAYYQEAGRAGRDEKKAYAILLYNEKDISDLEQKLEQAYPPEALIRRVYQALANYFKIAVGSGNLAAFDFDREEFQQRFNLPKIETFYALKRLEQEGFIGLSEGFYQSSRINFLVDGKDVYAFQVANKTEDDFIKLLLRMYGGELFTDFVNISEEAIAKNFNTTSAEVIRRLERLDKHGLLYYDRQKDKPQLTFLTPRFDAPELPLPVKEIAKRKKSDLHKLHSMVNYATHRHRCRTLILLDYFGEISDTPCGVCDICLEKKKEDISHYDLFRPMIMEMLKAAPCSVQDILKKDPHHEKEIISVIRTMADAGEIMYDAKGELLIKN